MSSADAAVLVPVKAFAFAKNRLAPELSPLDRSELARLMAGHVLAVAAPLPTFVVCDDEEVAAWARDAAEVIVRPEAGLNGAVAGGFSHLLKRGFAKVVVAHGDLPLARGFSHLLGFDGVTAVPDRAEDGTNVLCLPSSAGAFGFGYGAGSFARHCAEARRLGLQLRVLHDPDLALDIDTPADLAELTGLGRQTPFLPGLAHRRQPPEEADAHESARQQPRGHDPQVGPVPG